MLFIKAFHYIVPSILYRLTLYQMDTTFVVTIAL
jgi:hypothetical protein